jgi:hypothetical protein
MAQRKTGTHLTSPSHSPLGIGRHPLSGFEFGSDPRLKQKLFDLSALQSICHIAKEPIAKLHQGISPLIIGEATLDEIQDTWGVWHKKGNYDPCQKRPRKK